MQHKHTVTIVMSIVRYFCTYQFGAQHVPFTYLLGFLPNRSSTKMRAPQSFLHITNTTQATMTREKYHKNKSPVCTWINIISSLAIKRLDERNVDSMDPWCNCYSTHFTNKIYLVVIFYIIYCYCCCGCHFAAVL